VHLGRHPHLLDAAPGEFGYMHAVYTPGGQDVQKLKPLVPYSHHIHAKFYEMTEDYEEYSVPYDQIVKVLIEGGYDGYLASEWEGQRTTQDVLNAEQALVNARQNLLVAQHDRVVASYSLLSAIGRLSAQMLALPVSVYDPSVHYRQVRDSWFGMRTPSGQ